ncbi:LapA family protein, partial [Paracoccus sp. PXZ]
MRAIRIFFFVILAIVLMLLAAANRELVTVSLMPEALAQFTGGRWSLTMPAFVALFLAMVFGVLVGLVWEWLREAHLRAESSRRAQDLAQLQREVGDLRRTHAAPRD